MSSELRWFEINPPREITVEDVTALLRPLAHRRRFGWQQTPGLVVFELWSLQGRMSWRLGVDARIAAEVTQQLRAHLPGLGIARLMQMERPLLTVAAEIRLNTVAAPLRVDTAGAVATELAAVLGGLGTGEAACLQWVLGPAQQRRRPPEPFRLSESLGFRARPEPDATAARLWRQKAADVLFATRGGIGASARNPEAACGIAARIGNALKLTDETHASLQLSRATTGRARRLYDAASSSRRWSCVLNATELATVIGWPVQGPERIGAELPVIGGHVRPVPSKLLAAADDPRLTRRRVLGESLHPSQRGQVATVPVGTSLHHLHVIGPTGSGKSTLLAGLIQADIQAGRSVLVVEPRGDLVRDVLARIPAHRQRDVVVIDPAGDRSVGLNVLGGDQLSAERRADQIVQLLSELHGPNLGPRTTDVALHTLVAASRMRDGTLCDVPVLLTNAAFRRRVLAEVNDPLTLGPFFAWFDALSDAERAQVVAPLLNKLRALLSRPAVRRLLGQASPRFQIGELFSKRRIVLVNLNRGMLGAPAAHLIGALLLNQVWSAAQRRAALPVEHRRPVMAVVDEFQDYAGLSGALDFGEALAQSRGLGLGWTLAHQHLNQMGPQLRAAVLANARSRVVFRPATEDAKPLAATLGGEVSADDLLRLRAYEASVQLLLDRYPAAPFAVRTRPLPPWSTDPDQLRELSEARFGVNGAELDEQHAARWYGGDVPPDAPIGVRPRRRA
jgi:energy-coupling factor transporter ATP-binding protein EcfA2